MTNSLLILFGESFRLGHHGTRNSGSKESYDAQIKAAQTHIKFIENLQKINCNMVVSITSYTTQYDSNLTEIYKDVLIDNKFYKNLFAKEDRGGGQTTLIHKCINRIDNINKYDFILYMRIDIFLKDKFMEIFNPKSDKILFPSICWEIKCKIGPHPRVNDMMMFIPKKYFKLIKKINLHHHSWHDLITKHNLKYEDLDMMLNTYHDSDSAKDYNPIYYIVNRPQNDKWNSKKIFNKYDF